MAAQNTRAESEDFGEGWQAMFKLAGDHINSLLEDPARREAAGKSMNSVLFDLPLASPIEFPPVAARNILEGRVHGGFLALSSMITSLSECEHYFKKYPFKGRDVTRADHLRNICEMYFDRIVQFRDRLKEWMNSVNKIAGSHPIPIAEILKAFDRSFKWEIKNRNFTHHHGRFSNVTIDRLSMAHILSHSIEMEKFVPQSRTYRSEVKVWVKRVQASAKTLSTLLNMLANHVVAHIKFEGYVAHDAARGAG